MIEKEGMVGALAPLGATAMSGEARVQMTGSALRMLCGSAADRGRTEPRPNELVAAIRAGAIGAASQSVACNGRHRLNERMARWLLMAHDCVDGDDLPRSHEFLATMLGVRRAGITVAVGQLKEAGLIDSGPPASDLNRRGLEASACECYRTVKEQYEQLLPSPQPA